MKNFDMHLQEHIKYLTTTEKKTNQNTPGQRGLPPKSRNNIIITRANHGVHHVPIQGVDFSLTKSIVKWTF